MPLLSYELHSALFVCNLPDRRDAHCRASFDCSACLQLHCMTDFPGPTFCIQKLLELLAGKAYLKADGHIANEP